MDMKKVLILGLSLVVLVLAVVFLMGKSQAKATVQEPTGRLEMTTSAIEVVEGVPNSARIYFKNLGGDVKHVKVYIPKERTCDGECETPDVRFDAVPSSGTLYMDDMLITNEEDSFRFVITPWGVDDFTIPVKVTYRTGDKMNKADCEGNTCKDMEQTFMLHVRVTDGLVLETQSISFVPDARNAITLKFKNIGRTEIRNIRVRVEGEKTGLALNKRCFSADASSDGETSTVLKSGDETTISFEATSPRKPDVLKVEVTYDFLDREMTKTFEIPVE